MGQNRCGTFLGQFLKRPGQIGAVAPSSRYLARRMLATVDFAATETIVELGPGTGVFSREILARLRPETTYFALEINETMVTHLAEHLPELTVHHDSAARLGHYLQQHESEHADAVISGLPWAAFGAQLQDELLGATLAGLKPGGFFATFAYLQGLVLPAGKRFAAKLQRHFSTVNHSAVVWRNLPPALVYRCWK